jgi:hypothetical protein
MHTSVDSFGKLILILPLSPLNSSFEIKLFIILWVIEWQHQLHCQVQVFHLKTIDFTVLTLFQNV